MTQRTYYSEDARRNAQRQQLILAMAVASVSLSLGAIVALLFAPESGDKIRQEISDQLESLLERSNETAQKMSDEAQKRANNAYHNVEEQINKARN